MLISTIISQLHLQYEGNDFEVTSLAPVNNAKADHITFLEDAQYVNLLENTNAGAVILRKEFAKKVPSGVGKIICDNPQLTMAYISKYFAKPHFSSNESAKIDQNANIHPTAVIGEGSVIESGVHIMANAVIGSNALVKQGSIIYPNVVVYDDCIIGKDCILHAGSIIGCDGYGYAHTSEGLHVKIYHNGNVVLEDDVEIGANTTVDRAVFGSTRIGKGTKIDNLVQIAHNCHIGEACIIVSQTGISGSTNLGRNVTMGGQSATSGHLSIGDFATIAGRGGVTKSIEGKKVYAGFPLQEHKKWLKTQVKILKFFNK